MGKKLNNAPVFYTVAQVQFNPILNLDSYVPAIQSKLRASQFSDYRNEIIHQLVMPFGGIEAMQTAAPTISQRSRHIFGNIAGRTSFSLESNAISLQTTEYETFEVFSSTMLNGLRILHDALHLDFVERIGLRYLDAVQPLNSTDSLTDYLVPEVVGLSAKVEGQLVQSVSDTTSETNAGQLVSRVIIRDGHVGLPMELSALAPVINPRFTQQQGRHAIIDTDASRAAREGFDLAAIEARLRGLHDEIEKSFNATVTLHAKAAWA